MKTDFSSVCLHYTLYKFPLWAEDTEGEKQNKVKKKNKFNLNKQEMVIFGPSPCCVTFF